MSQIDTDTAVSGLEEIAEQSDSENLKLVPVTESIRYRKRAQSAEKKAETLNEQLAQANQKVSELSDKLKNLQVEQNLTRKLFSIGAIDLETAILIAKARLQQKPETDIDSCIEQLKKEKQYLFASTGGTIMTTKTASAKDRISQPQTTLERAAKRAARTGSRTDLQEYLKLRRNFL